MPIWSVRTLWMAPKLLVLKFTPDLKWNSNIDSGAKDAVRMVGSIYRSMRLLTPESLLYLYKSQIRPRMEYCSHIWAGSSNTILSALDRVQRRMRGLDGEEHFASLQSLSHRRNVASLSLSYRYFYGKFSDEFHLLVPPVRDFPIRTRFAKSREAHPNFLNIATPRCKFHSARFFPVL